MKVKEVSVRRGSYHASPQNESQQDGIECTITADIPENADVAENLAVLQAMADKHVNDQKERALKQAEKNIMIAAVESNVEHLKSHVAGITQAMKEVERQLAELMEVKDPSEDGDSTEENHANESIEVLGENTGADNLAAGVGDLGNSDQAETQKAAAVA